MSLLRARLSFFFNAFTNVWRKFAIPSASRYWAKILRDRFRKRSALDDAALHVQTGGVTLTAPQPLNNIVRVGPADLRHGLGGGQSLHPLL